MEKVFLSIGSNIGDSLALIRKTFNIILKEFPDARISKVWKSKAIIYIEQPDFYNAATCFYCKKSPEELLDFIQSIERDLKRVRNPLIPKGPRSIDIDIIYYGSKKINKKHLVIPHPDRLNRAFVIVPILELEDNFIDPITNIKISNYLPKLAQQVLYL